MSRLLPQDILLAIVLLEGDQEKTFEDLGIMIGISASQCYLAVKRLANAKLVDPKLRVSAKANLLEFLVHGIKYAFPIETGKVVKGIPTAHTAPVWKEKLLSSETERFVWAHPMGRILGTEIVPLYKTIPDVSLKDKKIYDIMAILDSLRLGKARERDEAAAILKELIYVR